MKARDVAFPARKASEAVEAAPEMQVHGGVSRFRQQVSQLGERQVVAGVYDQRLFLRALARKRDLAVQRLQGAGQLTVEDTHRGIVGFEQLFGESAQAGAAAAFHHYQCVAERRVPSFRADPKHGGRKAAAKTQPG